MVPTDGDGRVMAFVEKPPREEAPTNLINAGTYVLEPSVLDRIAAGRRVSIERETFPAMVGRRAALYALATDDYWLDAGRPDQYLPANLDVARRCPPPACGPPATAPAGVDPDGPVLRSARGLRGSRRRRRRGGRQSVLLAGADGRRRRRGRGLDPRARRRDRARAPTLSDVGASATASGVAPAAVLVGARVPEPAEGPAR